MPNIQNRFLDGFSSCSHSSPPDESYLGFGVQDKQRVLSLPTIWFQIDTAIFRGHLDEMMPDVDCFDHSLPPIDPNAGSVRVSAAALVSQLAVS